LDFRNKLPGKEGEPALSETSDAPKSTTHDSKVFAMKKVKTERVPINRAHKTIETPALKKNLKDKGEEKVL